MRTTEHFKAGPTLKTPEHRRFAEQITEKYRFAPKDYLGRLPLLLLRAESQDSPVQHVSLHQYTLQLKLNLQLLKQEERVLLRTHQVTLQMLEKVAQRHEATERQARRLASAEARLTQRLEAGSGGRTARGRPKAKDASSSRWSSDRPGGAAGRQIPSKDGFRLDRQFS
ncbi:hypothetical protein LJK88_26950 [Paenibacillus sp. P26]|nr:hypothetical protein LJK88_26950 [Paenibacillus sp. P26]